MPSLDRERLAATTINGLDAVLIFMNLTVEIVSAVSPTPKDTEERLTGIANRFDEFARKLPQSKTRSLMQQLSVAMISTERIR